MTHFKSTLSIDTEDWTHFGFQSDVDVNSRSEHSIEAMIDSSLSLLKKTETRATFFVVGSLADTHPDVIRKIAENGHEVACHGYSHRLIGDLTIDEFRADTLRAKFAIESAVGGPIYGYRAPAFSLDRKQIEYFEVLRELGFTYDSSLVGRNSELYEVLPNLIEVPPLGVRIGNRGISTSGGFFFRALPYWVTRSYYHITAKFQKQPPHYYFHTWEIHPHFPRRIRHPIWRFIQYFNLSSVHYKLERHLATSSLMTIQSKVGEWQCRVSS